VEEGCYAIFHPVPRLLFSLIRHIASLNWSPSTLFLRLSVDCLHSVTWLTKFHLLMFDCEIIWQNTTCLHSTPLWMYDGDSISKLKFRLNWMLVACTLVGVETQLKYNVRCGQVFILDHRKWIQVLYKRQ